MLTDEPTETRSRSVRDVGQPSTDSSLLLNDTSNATLESVLKQRKVKTEQPLFVRSPLEAIDGRTYGLVSASHLRAGELMQTQIVRIFQPEAGVRDDLIANQSNQYIYGLSDDIELTLDLQGANGSVPGFQGPYLVERRVGINNGNIFQDIAVQAKFRLGEIFGARSSAVLGLTVSRPQFTFFDATGRNLPAIERPQEGLVFVPSFEVPFTFLARDDRYAFTVSPKFAYFPQDNAIYTPVNPGTNASFGLTAGVGLGGSFKISPRFQVRGDITPILLGNNTVDRNSGLPDRVLPYNIGIRYLVNPRLGLDVFVSNTFGNTGGPSMVAFSNSNGFGAALTFTPERALYLLDFPANRKFAESFNQDVPPEIRRLYVPASFDLLDGSTIAGGTTRLTLQASTGPISTSVRTGTLDDFEAGFYANFAPSGPDESDGGVSTKVRLLHQPSGDPFTLSTLFTIGRTSSRACNFVNGTTDGLDRALNNLPTACPGVPGVTPAGDRGPIPPNLLGLVTENIGELFVLSLSFPAQYGFEGGHSLWINPKIAYLQRSGDRSPLVGASIGGSIRVAPGFELVAQVTPVFRGENGFIGNTLERLLPWQAGVRFTPGLAGTDLSLNVYATNSVGLSPYQSLRVRADNQISVGLGFQFPF